jgi:hypothetical protein
MPFRYAPYWLAALLALTVLGFWPGYFSILAKAPWGFHLHGISATLWLILLGVQSWSAHARQMALHRSGGMASLVLFPVFFAGSAGVIWSMAAATAAGDPFYQIYGARLATMDLISTLLLGYLYYHALAERGRVQLHARYLLATPLPLIMPIVGRVFAGFVPGLVIHGPHDFALFAWSVRLSSVVALALTAWLYVSAPRHGKPFAVAGAVLLVQTIVFDTLGATYGWDAAYRSLALLPVAPLLLTGLVAGAAVAWFGWAAGQRPRVRAVSTG